MCTKIRERDSGIDKGLSKKNISANDFVKNDEKLNMNIGAKPRIPVKKKKNFKN
jgi:hypothetical protein